MLRTHLRTEQRRELERLRRQAVGRVAGRAHRVLLSDQSYRVSEIAQIAGCGRDVVRHWLHRYDHLGIPDLYDEPRSGRPRTHPLADVVADTQMTQSPPCSGHVQTCGSVGLLAALMKNQLTAPAGPLDADGINDKPLFNCVDESFAAAIQYLTGKTVYGEELKDAEYGDKYQGGTALRVYVDQATDRARKVYGVTAEAFNSTDTTKLISQARTWLRQGFPVIATIPSAWGTAHSESVLANPNFSTHVVVFYTEDGTHMGAMNPWADSYKRSRMIGGLDDSATDRYGRFTRRHQWQQRLQQPYRQAGRMTAPF